MDLQELITRGRFLFSKAPSRLDVFVQVNGRKTSAEIAKALKRHVNNVHRDLKTLSDTGLLQPKTGKDGEVFKKDGYTVYMKIPLARTVPLTYFRSATRSTGTSTRQNSSKKQARTKRLRPLAVPSANEVVDICKHGEDQLYEFKARGTDIRKITRKIGAMLNTRQGGIILYGVEDDGTFRGSDLTRQRFDQMLQNSIKNSISPAAVVTLQSVSVVGSEILVVIVPPWNRWDVYQFDERVLIRKGTNDFAAKPEELRKLHRGEYVI